ncbi:hypothetical protein DFJ63DRAFT_336825 [Scheffersomyces coipomensis]|uniref:uncharacterized protein n=1 Tax=Scheffersomyces coipomensis TaxID=1788519 RepID=UPI00315DF7A8
MYASSLLFALTAATTVFAGFSNQTTITTDIIVTEFTTYCPYSTEVVVTICDQESICAPSTITVTEATTLVITEPCLIETTLTSSAAPTVVAAESTIYETRTCTECAPATSFANATTPEVSTLEAGAGSNQVAVGAFAGLAIVAAALI